MHVLASSVQILSCTIIHYYQCYIYIVRNYQLPSGRENIKIAVAYTKPLIRIYIASLFYEGFTINDTVTCNNIQMITLLPSIHSHTPCTQSTNDYIVTFHSLTYTMYTIYKLFHFHTHTHSHTQSHTRQMLRKLEIYNTNTISFK